MKVKDLIKELQEANPEAEVSISVDVSTDSEMLDERAYADEYLHWQANSGNIPEESLDITLLFSGWLNYPVTWNKEKK